MKKIILTLITAMLTIGAMAQVNAVGIPFGIGKSKAVELLNSKYGAYDDYALDRITYYGFRIDGVSYATASFMFDDSYKFVSANFTTPIRDLNDTDGAIADLNEVVEELKKRYTVVNLAEYGANQSYSDDNGTIATLYRALPKNAAQVEHSYMITVLTYADVNGIRIMTTYEPKDIK